MSSSQEHHTRQGWNTAWGLPEDFTVISNGHTRNDQPSPIHRYKVLFGITSQKIVFADVTIDGNAYLYKIML